MKKKHWWIIGAAVAVIVAAVAAWLIYDSTTNTYLTPIKTANKNYLLENRGLDPVPEHYNGFAKKEVQDILALLKQGSEYAAYLEEEKSRNEIAREMNERDIGSDWEMYLEVVGEEKLGKEDLEAYTEELNRIAEIIDRLQEESADWDDAQWLAFGEKWGLRETQSRKLVQLLAAYGKKLKSAKVSDGYALETRLTWNGEKLKKPFEGEILVERVYEVDGRWIGEGVAEGLLWTVNEIYFADLLMEME